MKAQEQTQASLESLIEAIVTELCLVYNHEVTKPLVRVWCRFLADLTGPQIKQGYQRITKEYTYSKMPTPQQFREYATTVMPLEGYIDLLDEAKDMWIKLTTYAARYGSYKSMHFQNTALAEWIRNYGGWPEFCQLNEDEETWVRKDFLVEYQNLRKRNKEYDPLVLGRTDRGNYALIQKGECKRDVKFIGDISEENKKAIIENKPPKAPNVIELNNRRNI